MAGDEGEVWVGGSPSPVLGGDRLRLRVVGSCLCWCWRPRSVTCRVQRAGLPQIRRQPCLLTNKRAACSPGAGGRSADVQQNVARAHTSPKSPPHPGTLTPGAPQTLQCHSIRPVCPDRSPPPHLPLGLPLPQTILGSCSPGGCRAPPTSALHGPGTLTCHAGRPPQCMPRRGRRS